VGGLATRANAFASPKAVRSSCSGCHGTIFDTNEAQVTDDFIAAAVVRRMVHPIDHWHVGKIERADTF
jgi:hypothetical protein